MLQNSSPPPFQERLDENIQRLSTYLPERSAEIQPAGSFRTLEGSIDQHWARLEDGIDHEKETPVVILEVPAIDLDYLTRRRYRYYPHQQKLEAYVLISPSVNEDGPRIKGADPQEVRSRDWRVLMGEWEALKDEQATGINVATIVDWETFTGLLEKFKPQRKSWLTSIRDHHIRIRKTRSTDL
ncbi:MAG: hypothetical protein JWS12_267 [Candidatus Saccharibacteria bacterium]|nr:hypothetical protein [Candidatus Saccharibacteria bacterium]